MSDMIDRDAAIALPPYDGDGDPAGQFDHHIFVKLADLRAMPAVEVGVKPLSWFEVEKSRLGGKYTADGYTIRYVEGLWLLDFAGGHSKSAWRFIDLETAKAAAQADYAARIRSALTVTPAPDAAQRREAEQYRQLAAWLRNPWSKMDGVERGPIPEWQGALMFEAANVIEAMTITPAPDAGKVQALVEQSKSLLNAYDAWARCVSGTPEDHIAVASLFSRTIRLRAALAAMKEG